MECGGSLWAPIYNAHEARAMAKAARDGKSKAQADPLKRNEYLSRRFLVLKDFTNNYIVLARLNNMNMMYYNIESINISTLITCNKTRYFVYGSVAAISSLIT
jgi:hypothetical protein